MLSAIHVSLVHKSLMYTYMLAEEIKVFSTFPLFQRYDQIIRRTFITNQWPSVARGHTRDFQLIFMKKKKYLKSQQAHLGFR